MSVASNYIICIDGCPNRRRTGPSVVACDFDGVDVIQHAREGRCADPAGDRYQKVFVLVRGEIVGEAAQAPSELDEICGSLLKRAEARAALLQPICEACPEMVKIGRRDQPLSIDVLCRLEKCCGGEGPGLVSLICGRCSVGKHDAELAKLKSEGRCACH
jgi:hypothetical protein